MFVCVCDDTTPHNTQPAAQPANHHQTCLNTNKQTKHNIELFFILTSVWLHQFYYLFGFLALVFVILCLTCAEITIVLCYFQLCSEDYSWWWRAYFTSGSAAIYLFAYSAFYFYTKLDITKFVPMVLYFIYMSVISYGFFCL